MRYGAAAQERQRVRPAAVATAQARCEGLAASTLHATRPSNVTASCSSQHQAPRRSHHCRCLNIRQNVDYLRIFQQGHAVAEHAQRAFRGSGTPLGRLNSLPQQARGCVSACLTQWMR